MSAAAAVSQAFPEGTAEVLALVEDALAENRVRLDYQPVVRGPGGRSPSFFEALLRITRPNGERVPANRFIDVVEPLELGRELDLRALQLGLAALGTHPTLRLSINVSPRTLHDPRWAAHLAESLARAPSAGQRLILELTEQAALDAPEVGALMAAFRPLGVTFALDDFGAGFSSFRNLKELRFEFLKIDGAFIRGIEHNADNRACTEAFVSVADHFGTVAVAECVERPEEARVLRDLGIDSMQGWLFGRPAARPVLPAA